MTHDDVVAVDRLSVTVPSELGAALRALAEKRGLPVSTVVTEAIAQQVRLAALDVALAHAERRFGPVPDEWIASAESELRPRRRAPRKRPRR
jgi:predicted transcriptional regulator